MDKAKQQQLEFEKTGKTPIDKFTEENKTILKPLTPEQHEAIQKVKPKPVVWPELKEETPAQKFDEGKLPYHLITPEFLEALCVILDFGQKKYAPRNWEKGMNWGRPFSALMRHMWSWWRKEGNDPETGKSHLWHAACCIMFLVTYEIRNTGDDDRP